jgi:uncharacterized protein YndB with AHSA1/START domain
MLSQPEPACLLIADISGYTSYLAGAELDHAQDILADLMTTVVTALRPTFRLAKLEGDAAFAYVIAERIDGSQLLDTVERTYFAFRRRLRDIAQATACECNACVLMPRLDLKFIAHHGSVIRHRIAGHEELVGSDVIVAHRLLKNHVVERLGQPAYAMFSSSCIEVMGVDPVALGMTEHLDTYDDLGEVVGWVHDLGAAWAAELERRRVVVSERDAGYILDVVQPAPRDIVWTFVTDPALRPRWQAGVTGVDQLPTSPRRGTGTMNHCMHGAEVLVEEILDWRPIDHVTIRTTLPNGLQATSTFAFEDAEEGTRLRILFTWGKNRREREAAGAMRDFIAPLVELGQSNLRDVLVEEMASRAPLAADAPPEPATPESQGRELREPIRL